MNEPVAHRYKFEEGDWKYGDSYDATGAPNDPDYLHYEPLYTRPVELTLTNEEIMEVYEKEFGLYNTPINFAWAILRKAQEK